MAYRRPFINPNDGFFRVLLDYAEELGEPTTTADERAAQRAVSLAEYSAYQLASQLAFASVTPEKARSALGRAGGNLEQAASALLADAGM